MSYMNLTIEELHELLVSKKVTPLELAKEAISCAKNDDNNAFETIMEEDALRIAEALTNEEPDATNPLWGIPFVIKDNMSTKNVLTTGSSNILKDYVPVFNATVVQKLLDSKAVPIGKTTLDELAMGGSGTTGHLGMTYNPWDETKTRLVGGSSCGSAAAVANAITPFGLGTDTGDSTRKPAAYAGLVGLKPTWGRISRYGVFPFCPSLDTVGIFTRSVKDCAYVLNVTAGRDLNDSTSSTLPVEDFSRSIGKDATNLKVAVIKEIVDAISDEENKKAFNNSLAKLREKGVTVDEISFSKSILESLFPTYFVISCAEATSNNANLDGIKFGPYHDGKTYEEVMTNTRTVGFSELIKRRFIIGSYSLFSENQHDLFLRAQKNRRRIVEEVNKVLEKYDFIYAPASASVAPKLDGTADKLSDEYLISDNHLVIGNFAGLPSITLPLGFEDGLPLAGNLTGRAYKEADLFQMAALIEESTGLKNISKGGRR